MKNYIIYQLYILSLLPRIFNKKHVQGSDISPVRAKSCLPRLALAGAACYNMIYCKNHPELFRLFPAEAEQIHRKTILFRRLEQVQMPLGIPRDTGCGVAPVYREESYAETDHRSCRLRQDGQNQQ